jgi:dipeptidyl aminopeptidase/acylaminoacyl peptidase
LADARRAHGVHLVTKGPAPQPFKRIAPAGAERVAYLSGGRSLMAWVMTPATPGRRPAVLFAHGGFALDDGDEIAPRAFLRAGYVVMLPTWRGENGNSGDFEMFYGEVDDAMAALDYLAKRPDVDASRLYAAGHSVGGTIAMLLAESDPRLRKAMACGGCPDLRGIVEQHGKPYLDGTPYDWRDAAENDLRSPARHLNSLRCPLRLYYGEDEALYLAAAQNMARAATALGRQVEVRVLPRTDHFSALEPAIADAVTFFGE